MGTGMNYRTREKPVPLQAGSQVPTKWQYIYIYITNNNTTFYLPTFNRTWKRRQKIESLYSVGCAQTIYTYLQWSRTFVYMFSMRRLHIYIYLYAINQPSTPYYHTHIIDDDRHIATISNGDNNYYLWTKDWKQGPKHVKRCVLGRLVCFFFYIILFPSL